MDNVKLATLLTESAELLSNDNNESEVLTESAAGAVAALLALIGVYVSIPLMSLAARRAQYKRIARESAKQVTREEIHEGVKFLNSLEGRIKTLFKQSKYKKFIDEGVITIRKDFIDASTSKDIDHIPFRVGYSLFTINLIKLSKLQNKYDEIITTSDRLSEYIKGETKEIAKLCDKVRDIVNTNKFIKDNFTLMLLFNDNKSMCACNLELKHPLVLNTSKYVQTKGKK